jgi:ribose/xylose/arabinose/galactoside ABC-type transport system permease subunit
LDGVPVHVFQIQSLIFTIGMAVMAYRIWCAIEAAEAQGTDSATDTVKWHLGMKH